MFEIADENRDGFLDQEEWEEFKMLMASKLPGEIETEWIKAIPFKVVDDDNDGKRLANLKNFDYENISNGSIEEVILKDIKEMN